MKSNGKKQVSKETYEEIMITLKELKEKDYMFPELWINLFYDQGYFNKKTRTP